jgi:hypothetical protein
MEYYRRKIDAELKAWVQQKERKTLLLRGARQVGKTTAIHHLAEQFEHFIEVDFNERKDLHYLFDGTHTPQEICRILSVLFQVPVIPGKTLLFFDEIQACPDAINRLRYFYERYPELHLVAAGSLLEFALESLSSFGVGRIHSLFMYPFSFEEFLWANKQEALSDMIHEASPQHPLPPILHEQAIRLLKTFMAIGGMPAVVNAYCHNMDYIQCQQRLSELILSFRDDFAKYNRRVPLLRLDATFKSVAEQGLGKFVYTKVAGDGNAQQIRNALETLILAGLVYPVTHTAANGIPLGAETNEKYRRMVMCDTGMLLRVLGLPLAQVLMSNNEELVNRGSIAETFVATELVKAMDNDFPAALFCWHREKVGSNAEVDYVLQLGTKICPVEVKSGTKGSMQSLRIFMAEKNIQRGIRTSLENFCHYEDVDVYPLYAVANIVKSV